MIEANLLKEFIGQEWHYTVPQEMNDLIFTSLSYDSRQTDANTLFFCKGAAFKESYLESAVAQGLQCYVSEHPYENCSAYGIIVTDIRAAMACIAQAFTTIRKISCLKLESQEQKAKRAVLILCGRF